MLTREQFQTIYDQGPDALFELVSALEKQVALLSAQVKELQERLDKDSHNSSEPPSGDGLRKKPLSRRYAKRAVISLADRRDIQNAISPFPRNPIRLRFICARAVHLLWWQPQSHPSAKSERRRESI